MNKLEYSLAVAADLPGLGALLTQCGLTCEGIQSAIAHCMVAKAGSKLAGMVALEPYGCSGLLRSLAVTPDCRGHSVGRTLCAKAFSYARLLGIEQLYLLTTDAERYFAALGFKHSERGAVPSEIQAAPQFRSLCPKSAICMARDLTDQVIHASRELLQLRPDVPGARMWAVSLQQTMLTCFEVEPHSRFDSHSHTSEQITMVLSGELFFELQGVVHCLRAGEVIAIPSGAPHAVWTEALPAKAVDAWSPVMRKYGPAKS